MTYPWRTSASAGLLGAAAICALSAVQKVLLDLPLAPGGFIVPAGFGFLAGMFISRQQHRLKALARRLEQEVASKSAQVARFSERAPVGIFRTALDGTLLYANARMVGLLGHGSHEFGPEFGSVLPLYVSLDDRERFLAGLREKGELVDQEVALKHKDGRTIWLSISAVLCEEAGPAFVDGFALDITERKKNEKAMQEARRQAEAASEAKSAFLANMSHEIRTPLNGIMGMLQLIAESAGKGSPLEGFADAALKSSRRLTTLLSDILDLARMEQGGLSLRCCEFDMAETLRRTHDLFAPSARKQGLEFKLMLDPNLPANLCGDQIRLQQIVGNVVGNSLKFTEKGHIVIAASAMPKTTDGLVRVLISVQDTGSGIPDDVLASLFESFTQADPSMTRRHQGAGLGLAICEKLSRLMGGNISVESEPGEGTTVHMSIPFRQSGKACVEQYDVEPELPGGLRILLAEDDRVNQIALLKLLERRGARVRTAPGGTEALALLHEQPFDCVLMDIEMPGMNGLEASRAIRNGLAGKNRADVPIIALTGSADARTCAQVVEAGMNSHLVKPVGMDELVRAILPLLPPSLPDLRKKA